jgi:hypothetical protein
MREHKLIAVGVAKNVVQLCAMTERLKFLYRQLEGSDPVYGRAKTD